MALQRIILGHTSRSYSRWHFSSSHVFNFTSDFADLFFVFVGQFVYCLFILHKHIITAPNFVASFVYGDHVYFWYREWAAEVSDGDRQVSIILQLKKKQNKKANHSK